MIDRASAILLTAISLVAVAAGSLLAVAGRGTAPRLRDARGAEFERLIGGLGLGADLELSHCSASFDPRVSRTCSNVGPLPEGAAYCQRHTGSVFVFDAASFGHNRANNVAFSSEFPDAKIP